MKTAILINPNAGSSEKGQALREACQSRADVELWDCDNPRELTRLVSRAEHAGTDTLVAAGGDGTIHRLIQEIARQGSLERFRLGVIPLGTGNDFARTLGMPEDPVESLERILFSGIEIRIDAIYGRGDRHETLCLNHLSAGLGAQVQQETKVESKRRWGFLSYLGGAARAAARSGPHQVTLEIDGKDHGPFEALNVVVANGVTAGGGFAVAPQANPVDAQMDVILVTQAGALDLVDITARLLGGDYTENDAVLRWRGRRVRVRSRPPLLWSVDGDRLGHVGNFDLRVLPQAIRVAGSAVRPAQISSPPAA